MDLVPDENVNASQLVGKSGMLAATRRSFPCTEDCNDLS